MCEHLLTHTSYPRDSHQRLKEAKSPKWPKLTVLDIQLRFILDSHPALGCIKLLSVDSIVIH